MGGLHKAEEIEVPKHRLLDVFQLTPLPQWADNKLRLELTLRTKELIELDLKHAYFWQLHTARQTFKKYIRRIDMSEQITLSNEQFYGLPQYLKSTYALWQGGYDPRSTMPKRTYYRHRKELLSHGINIDVIQASQRTNVVPLVRYLYAEPADIPQWAFDMNLVHKSAQQVAA